MSDLNYIDRTMEVKIAGQDATGLGVNYVGADTRGNLQDVSVNQTLTTSGTGNAVNAVLFSQDANGYTTVYIAFSGTATTGDVNLFVETSNDNIIWFPVPINFLGSVIPLLELPI